MNGQSQFDVREAEVLHYQELIHRPLFISSRMYKLLPFYDFYIARYTAWSSTH